MLDSGLAARLLHLTPNKLARRDPTSLAELGHLPEAFVVGELLKEASWMDRIAGVVLYTGERGYTHEDRLHVLPIDRLWTAP